MPFFARPNLDDTQFKQLTGSTLHLSGQTYVTTPSGLTLTANDGVYDIVLTAKGAGPLTDGYVLTYNDTKKQIELCLSAGSGGTQIYNGASPTTCTVGGLPATTSISGCTLSKIIEMIVAPALNPAVTPPSNTFVLSCLPAAPTGYYEVGTTITITGNATFNQGCVNPQYSSLCDKRSGAPNTYVYWSSCYGNICQSSSFLTNNYAYTTHTIVANESYCGCVCYNNGCPVLNSCGGIYCPALSAGATAALTASVPVTYPYFWGKSVGLPVAGQAIINAACTAGDICMIPSAGDICVANYNASGEYIWLAIPATSSKSKWQGCNSPSNCGTIPGLLFAAGACVSVNSPSSCWSSVPYNFYISNYATSVNYIMAFKNS